jgi:hypothetical protein
MIHDIIELLRKLCSAGMPSVFSYEQEHSMLEGNECRVEDSKPIAVMCNMGSMLNWNGYPLVKTPPRSVPINNNGNT